MGQILWIGAVLYNFWTGQDRFVGQNFENCYVLLPRRIAGQILLRVVKNLYKSLSVHLTYVILISSIKLRIFYSWKSKNCINSKCWKHYTLIKYSHSETKWRYNQCTASIFLHGGYWEACYIHQKVFKSSQSAWICKSFLRSVRFDLSSCIMEFRKHVLYLKKSLNSLSQHRSVRFFLRSVIFDLNKNTSC